MVTFFRVTSSCWYGVKWGMESSFLITHLVFVKKSSISDDSSLLSISNNRVLISIPYDFDAILIASRLSISNFIFSPIPYTHPFAS